MANANISTIGRFSSQMLTYLGTQRTVKSVNGTSQNTFKWANGPTYFPSPGSYQQAALGGGVVGNFSAASYNTTICYFLSRGTGPLYAQTMTALVIDMANTMGVSPQSLLEQSEVAGQLLFTDEAYRTFNIYRDPGNQVGTVTSVNNRFSLQYREIRA